MKMKLRSVLVLTALLIGVAGCGGAQSRYTSHMAKGDDFFAAANYEKARIEFRNALQILPNDAQARFKYGRSMERLGKLREAAGMYQGAIDSDTNHAGARAALGRVYVFAGAPEKALELVEPAMAKNPKDRRTAHGARARRARSSTSVRRRSPMPKPPSSWRRPTKTPSRCWRPSTGRATTRRAPIALLRTTLEKAPTATELRQVLSLLYLSLGDKAGAETEIAQDRRAEAGRHARALFARDIPRRREASRRCRDRAQAGHRRGAGQ